MKQWFTQQNPYKVHVVCGVVPPMISYSPLAVMTLLASVIAKFASKMSLLSTVLRGLSTQIATQSVTWLQIFSSIKSLFSFYSVSKLFLPFLEAPSPYKGLKPECVVGQITLLPLEFRCAFSAVSVLHVESCRRRGTNICSAITNDHNLHPQELLSHSTDRPERQQLKEALEAMQVSATHTAVVQWLLPLCCKCY